MAESLVVHGEEDGGEGDLARATETAEEESHLPTARAASEHEWHERVHEAACAGDALQLKHLLHALGKGSGGVDAVHRASRQADDAGNTLMHTAAGSWADGGDAIRVLMQHGASEDTHARNDDGRTPLHRAAVANNHGAARALLKLVHGSAAAFAALPDAQGRTALHLATSFKNTTVAALLLEPEHRKPKMPFEGEFARSTFAVLLAAVPWDGAVVGRDIEAMARGEHSDDEEIETALVEAGLSVRKREEGLVKEAGGRVSRPGSATGSAAGSRPGSAASGKPRRAAPLTLEQRQKRQRQRLAARQKAEALRSRVRGQRHNRLRTEAYDKYRSDFELALDIAVLEGFRDPHKRLPLGGDLARMSAAEKAALGGNGSIVLAGRQWGDTSVGHFTLRLPGAADSKGGGTSIVVLDDAPTGHAVRLFHAVMFIDVAHDESHKASIDPEAFARALLHPPCRDVFVGGAKVPRPRCPSFGIVHLDIRPLRHTAASLAAAHAAHLASADAHMHTQVGGEREAAAELEYARQQQEQEKATAAGGALVATADVGEEGGASPPPHRRRVSKFGGAGGDDEALSLVDDGERLFCSSAFLVPLIIVGLGGGDGGGCSLACISVRTNFLKLPPPSAARPRRDAAPA